MLKRTVLALFAALALGAVAVPASARVGVDLDVNVGVPPPAPIYEAAPPPRVGYVWAPGYWGWGPDGRHVWIKGRWIGERHGYHWVPDHWEAREGRHHFVGGYWAR
jgi:hypothetical protein